MPSNFHEASMNLVNSSEGANLTDPSEEQMDLMDFDVDGELLYWIS